MREREYDAVLPRHPVRLVCGCAEEAAALCLADALERGADLRPEPVVVYALQRERVVQEPRDLARHAVDGPSMVRDRRRLELDEG